MDFKPHEKNEWYDDEECETMIKEKKYGKIINDTRIHQF